MGPTGFLHQFSAGSSKVVVILMQLFTGILLLNAGSVAVSNLLCIGVSEWPQSVGVADAFGASPLPKHPCLAKPLKRSPPSLWDRLRLVGEHLRVTSASIQTEIALLFAFRGQQGSFLAIMTFGHGRKSRSSFH